MAKSNRFSSFCVVGIMDQLWFHQIILFSESNISLLCAAKHLAIDQTPDLAAEEEEPSSSSDSCPNLNTPVAVDDSEIEEEIIKETRRPVRASSGLTPAERRVRRAFSSSPSAHARPRKRSVESSRRLLQKSMSCRSLEDLEMEEVRGFMDLGFIFKREHLSPRIVSVVPGLQRLAAFNSKINQSTQPREEEQRNGIIAEEEGEGKTQTPTLQLHARPYLSEAWLIRRPDSPLLNLRVPRASPASEMKQHLRFWARTVASVIEQES